MDGYLRQSTASQARLIGPFLDDTDFKTAETALTIANTDIKLRANGTTLSNKNSGGGTHQVNGTYSVTFDATDTANVGELKYSVVISGALPVFGSYVVLEEAVYDAFFAAAALGYVDGATVNATKIGGTSQTGRDIGASVLLSAGTGTGQLDFTSGVVKANVTQNAGSAITSAAGIQEVKVASIAANAVNAAAIANGAIDAATFANDTGLAAIRSNTAQAGAATTITLDAAASAVNDFYKNTWLYIVSGTGVGQVRLISAYVGATKVATVPTWATNPDNTSVFTILPLGDGSVTLDTQLAAIQADTDDIQARLPAALTANGNMKSDTLRVAGTVQTAGDIIADTDDIQARLPAALTANGNIKADTLRVGGTVQTGGDLSAQIATASGYIDTEVAAILAAVDTEVAAILALLDDARGEPGQGNPPVNPDMATKVDYLYKWTRNKKDNDGATTQFYADNASTVDQKRTTSVAGGTVTEGEIATGP